MNRSSSKDPWRVVAAVARGSSHQKKDVDCQDALAYRIFPGDVLAVALADGAGTAEHAKPGAQAAVEGAVRSAAEELARQPRPEDAPGWEAILRQCFAAARQALVEQAEAQERDLRGFATTLICLLASTEWLAVGQLGDGAAVILPEGGELYLATEPQRGEYANETNFLTAEDALDRLQVRVEYRRAQALAVMSDGLTRLAMKMPGYEPYEPFFQPLWAFARQDQDQEHAEEQLAGFLNSERVLQRTDDDKALLLAIQVSEESARVIRGEDRVEERDAA